MTKYLDILKNNIENQKISITDPQMDNKINLLKEDAEKWLKPLGKNSIDHSKSIEFRLDHMIPDRIKKEMTVAEMFILLYSIYLHDVGYIYDKNNHFEASYNEILKNYLKYGLKDKFQAKAVAIVCRGHGSEKDYPIAKIDNAFGVDSLDKNYPINLRYITSLLRLADDLDNAYTRVAYLYKHKSIRNLISFVDADFGKWRIIIHCTFEREEELKKLFEIKNYIQERLNEIKTVLEQKKIYYWKIETKPEIENLMIEMTKKPDVDKPKKSSIGELSIRLHRNNDRLYMKEIKFLRDKRKRWISFAIVQLSYDLRELPSSKEPIYDLKDKDKVKNKIWKALEIAKNNSIDIILFPELCFYKGWPDLMRKKYGKMIIIGSKYRKNSSIGTLIYDDFIDEYHYLHALNYLRFENLKIANKYLNIEQKEICVNVFNTRFAKFSILWGSNFIRDSSFILNGYKGLDFLLNPCFDPNIKRLQYLYNQKVEDFDIFTIQLNRAEKIKNKEKKFGGSCIFGKENSFVQKRLVNSNKKFKKGLIYKLYEFDNEMMVMFDIRPKSKNIQTDFFYNFNINDFFIYRNNSWFPI